MTRDQIQTVLDALQGYQPYAQVGTQVRQKTDESIAILQAALAEPSEPTTVLRLIDTIKYLVGIAERGEGRKARDDELPEQFVLGYVKRLEAALAEPSEADDTSCPTCGEDGGTSCGMPNCGLLIGESDVEPQNEPVAWQLGHRFYTSLKDAEYAWRNDCAFLGTSYVPEPLFTHPASKPEPSEPVGKVVSSGPADFPIFQWISADHSLRCKTGDLLFTHPASKVEPSEPDKDLIQALTERDEYHDMADKLAEGIALHFDGDIGEHSSSNSPWDRALDLLDSAACAETMRLSKQAALAEPSEPVAWLYEAEYSSGGYGADYFDWKITTNISTTKGARQIKPLFTHPAPSKPAPLPELQREELLGAIARGWCTDRNMHKIMDSDLAFDIADSILAAAREKK